MILAGIRTLRIILSQVSLSLLTGSPNLNAKPTLGLSSTSLDLTLASAFVPWMDISCAPVVLATDSFRRSTFAVDHYLAFAGSP